MTSEETRPLSTNSATNHEFINSLTSVRCLTELLSAYPGLAEVERIRFLNIMQEETARLVRLSHHLETTPEAVETG